MSDAGRATMGKNGRLVIPVSFRRAMGLTNGGEVLLRYRNGCVEIEPPNLALERARRTVRKYASDRDLSGELLRERKEEAADD